MRLCMGIIGDNLEFKQIINNTDGQDDPMNLERYRITAKVPAYARV